MNTAHRPLVTIGIPTYNRADGYLREVLECALAQTYPNIEIDRDFFESCMRAGRLHLSLDCMIPEWLNFKLLLQAKAV